jgi:uroporphyrinogen-III synthase
MPETSVGMIPLQDKRILVTRTREQASVLSDQLRALGAEPVEFPTIHIVPPQQWEKLDQAFARLFVSSAEVQPYYSWLVFTSANGVNICCERLQHLGYDLRAMQHVRIATIGPATAAVLRRYGLTADLVPDAYIAESVAEALIEDSKRRGETLNGNRILLPRAAEARDILITLLQEAGALVDEIVAYQTIPVATDDERGREILHLLRSGHLDIITFTSSSTVRNFVRWLNSGEATGSLHAEPHHAETFHHRTRIACIGPITAQTAREYGLEVDIEAKTFTISGLVEAIVTFFQHQDPVPET